MPNWWTKEAGIGVALMLGSGGCNDFSKPIEKPTDANSIEVGAGPDLFQPMDGTIKLAADEIKGRNAWHLWTAGNEEFWDLAARRSKGLIDLLKTLDSRRRGSRFRELGLVNEPGFRAATKCDEFGLWLDERISPEPSALDPKIYGRSSGVLGFRLFVNPEFSNGEQTAITLTLPMQETHRSLGLTELE